MFPSTTFIRAHQCNHDHVGDFGPAAANAGSLRLDSFWCDDKLSTLDMFFFILLLFDIVISRTPTPTIVELLSLFLHFIPSAQC